MSERRQDAWEVAQLRYPASDRQAGFVAGAAWADDNPQPRTITTSEEMDALPLGAVILSDKGHAWQKVPHRAGFMSTGGWLCADPIYPGIYNDPDMQKGAIFYDGPATVLYLPEVTDDE